jgi:two-component system capsular synthesis response regulator RcsB
VHAPAHTHHTHTEGTIVNLRVILADDHPFVLLGIKVALASNADITVVGEASSPSSLIGLLHATPCDVLVTDLTMPEGDGKAEDGLQLVRHVRREWPGVRIVVLTSLTNGAILRAIVADGAIGILNKIESMDEVIVAVRLAACGRSYISKSVVEALAAAGSEAVSAAARLSPRETEVVRMFATGMSIREIARRLDRDVRTVSRQKRDAMVKLGVHNDPGLFAFAHAHGLA